MSQPPLLQSNDQPLRAHAIDGDVVLSSSGRGRPIDGAFTPEAIMDSLEGLLRAAEEAIRQRQGALAIDPV